MAASKANPSGKPAKKRNISESVQGSQAVSSLLSQGIDPLHLNQVPSRRSQSKNDKYKDTSDLKNGLTLGSLGQASGKLGQPQVRTSQ